MKPHKKESANTLAGLEVTANVDGFCRADRAWSNRPTRVLLSEFNEEQIAALRACPGLKVIDIELTDEEVEGASV